jgi:hypothetical protein
VQIRNNRGELIGEINTIIRPGEGVITTNTISTRDNVGYVKTETVYGGKILP